MKLIGFRVSEIRERNNEFVLTFEPGAIKLANNFDAEFMNVDGFEVTVTEQYERYAIQSTFDNFRMAPTVDITKLFYRIDVDSIANIETFKRLVAITIDEYKMGKEVFAEDITSLFASLENMNKLHLIDMALDKRDFDTVRKLVS